MNHAHLHLRTVQVLRDGALSVEAIPCFSEEIASGEEQDRPRNDIMNCGRGLFEDNGIQFMPAPIKLVDMNVSIQENAAKK